MIIAGESDVMIAKRAERWLYDWILRNGIEVYEYQKNILHGKLALTDKNFFTIGSYNINNISTYASIEFNLDIRDDILGVELHDKLTDIMTNDCIKITKSIHHSYYNPARQLIRWLSYQFYVATFNLFTLFFKRSNQ